MDLGKLYKIKEKEYGYFGISRIGSDGVVGKNKREFQ